MERRRLAEGVAALWVDQERYARMGRAARKRLEEHFNIEKTARRCLDLYKELLVLKRSSTCFLEEMPADGDLESLKYKIRGDL